MSPSFTKVSAGRHESGFTLIEVIVVISIITILSGYLLLYTGRSRGQIALSVEEAKLAQVISRSKALAISTYGVSQAPCGYGVNMQYGVGTYTLYSYSVPDCTMIPAIDATIPGYVKLQTFSLPKNIIFEDGATKLDAILFVPPDPQTMLWSGGILLTNSPGNIYLKTQDGASHASVSINPAGQISF